MIPLRPSRFQEMIRQWILLIPLATAAAGSATVMLLPEDNWAELLTPMFFVGALVVTTSMMHQRRMANDNFHLAEAVQGANARLDILHRLSLELNKSLDVRQVAQTVLESTVRSMPCDAGALWLRLDLLPPGAFESAPQSAEPMRLSPPNGARHWSCIASQGFDLPAHHQTLSEWDSLLESGEVATDAHIFGVDLPSRRESQKDAVDDIAAKMSARLGTVLEEGQAAASIPLRWEGAIVGILLVSTRQRRLKRDDIVLIDDIGLVAAPALQNALLYGAATARAEIDGLTNLYNHRVLQERLNQEIARATRGRLVHPKTQMSVAVMDLTDFKIFNDTYGHATGDRVLRYVADCLRATFRASDVVGRYGGDEFVAILPDTDLSGVEVICRRAIKAVGAQPFEAADGSSINVRIACGVATFPQDGDTITDLLKAADARLYLAKGRGQLIIESSATAPALDRMVAQPMWQKLGVLESLIAAIDSKDHYTRRHAEMVWKYSMMIARALDLPRDMIPAIGTASLVHDVGKIVVPDAILRKPGRLTPEEMQMMQQHVTFGALIVKDIPHLDLVLGGVRHHHERFDGSGYPDRLGGEEIPFMGRLIAVPDAFVAMIVDRPYRKAYTTEQAVEEIERGSGIQFDPEIVEAFTRALREEVCAGAELVSVA